MATTEKKSILRVLREKFKYTQEEVSQYLGIKWNVIVILR